MNFEAEQWPIRRMLSKKVTLLWVIFVWSQNIFL